MEFHVPLFRVFNAGDEKDIESFKEKLKAKNIGFLVQEFTFQAYDHAHRMHYSLQRVKIIFSREINKLLGERE